MVDKPFFSLLLALCPVPHSLPQFYNPSHLTPFPSILTVIAILCLYFFTIIFKWYSVGRGNKQLWSVCHLICTISTFIFKKMIEIVYPCKKKCMSPCTYILVCHWKANNLTIPLLDIYSVTSFLPLRILKACNHPLPTSTSSYCPVSLFTQHTYKDLSEVTICFGTLTFGLPSFLFHGTCSRHRPRGTLRLLILISLLPISHLSSGGVSVADDTTEHTSFLKHFPLLASVHLALTVFFQTHWLHFFCLLLPWSTLKRYTP